MAENVRNEEILECVDSDDDIDISDVDDEYVMENQLQTESEQEEAGSDNENESPETCSNKAGYFIGKDKKTKWRSEPSYPNVRTRACNIITHLPGTIGNRKDAKTPLECWNLFFDDEMLSRLVENTNIYISSIDNLESDKSLTKPTTKTELKAFIGMLYLMGILHGGRMKLEEFWSEDFGAPIVAGSMSLRRFRFLLRCIRMDNVRTRSERKRQDKLAPIRDVYEKFRKNCQTAYSTGEYVTIDEMLVAFRGRCSFRMYIPSKPARYGVKVYILADARTFYAKNLEIYVGKQPDGPYQLSNKPEDVVVRLTEPLHKTNRNLTVDNWFTSYQLMIRLLKEYKITLVGTLRRNKKEIPNQFVDVRKREAYSSLFGFQENCTMVSYVPKKFRNVILLSSIHFTKEVDKSTGEQKKPEIISLYNKTKIGVDMLDAMIAEYNVTRTTRRWPLTLLFSFLNIAGVNAHIIYKSNGCGNKTRREFLKELGGSLIRDNMTERAENQRLQRKVREICQKFSVQKPSVVKSDPPFGKRGKCVSCKNSSTKYYCVKCKAWLCLTHSVFTCQKCFNKINETESD